jgi:ATP-dependent exoDNAse (exonuclease V) alpha subunit
LRVFANEILKPFDAHSLKGRLLHAAKVIVIDEISMLSASQLDVIMARLRSITNSATTKEALQKKVLVLVGDLAQLPPVCPHTRKRLPEVEDEESEKKTEDNDPPKIKIVFCRSCHITQAHSWQFVERLELVTIMRQVADPSFSEFLARLRESTPSQEDIDTVLKECYVSEDEVAEIIAESLTNKEEELTILTSHRKERDIYNDAILRSSFTNEEIVEIPVHAWSTPRNRTIINHPDLQDWIHNPNWHQIPAIAIGCRVMLTKTQRDPKGRMYPNGAVGTVHALRMSKKHGHVTRVEVVFDDDLEQKPFGLNMNETKSYDHLAHRVTKKTFPLVLAYAMTIHKSQGVTLRNKTLVHLKGVFAFGQTYVALSRCASRKNLRIVGGITPDMCLPIPAEFR